MKEYRYKLSKIDQPDTDLVVLELVNFSGLPVLKFKPGQYVMISYRNARGNFEDKHAFSIASAPNQDKSLMLGVRIIGDFTKGLLGLKQGDEVFVAGPFGDFVFNEEKYPDAVFIAGGIGVTPFYSAIKYATDNGLSNKLTLLYSSRTFKGIAFFDELEELRGLNKNLTCLYSVTDGPLPDNVPNLINKRFDEQTIVENIGNVQGKTFFICGPSAFMAAMKTILKKIGASNDQIKLEEFSMIPDSSLVTMAKNLSFSLGLSAALFLLTLYSMSYSVGSSVMIITPWYISKAAAVISLVLMFIIILLGSGMTTSYGYKMFKPVRAWLTHKYLGVALGVTVLVHVVSLLFDELLGFKLRDILIPFVSNYEPIYLNLGIAAFYLLLITIASSIFLRLRAPRFWRNSHYLVYPMFAFALVHGYFIGSDSSLSFMKALYSLLTLAFIIIIIYRFGFYRRRLKINS